MDIYVISDFKYTAKLINVFCNIVVFLKPFFNRFVDLIVLAGFVVLIVFLIFILGYFFVILWDSFLAEFFPDWYFRDKKEKEMAVTKESEPVQTSEPELKKCKKKGKKK